MSASVRESSAATGINPEDCFKVLLATDIHLGYLEENEIRGNDSFVAFEEILYYAKERKVDFVLLGGDLFHHSMPSKATVIKCMNILKKFVMGDDPIKFEILSDYNCNFEDPNLNISIPVFSIHGNHDDQSGAANTSSVEMISEPGLINYFGKWNNLMEVNVSPILLKKGITQVALYGLSHIRDNRLSRLFKETKVFMEQPNEGSGDWFNILVLHQNRVDRGRMNYIPEEILPEFLDFILWGHEHDCNIDANQTPGKNYYVSQPGSSVATSLSEGESIVKHVGILYIHKNQFKLEKIKLQTVRPFVFKSIDLINYEEELDINEDDVVPKVKEIISKVIEQMIKEARTKESCSASQPKLPLIRLRVVYRHECQVFNAIRFGQQFSNRVANPSEMLHMLKYIKRVKVEKTEIDEKIMANMFNGQNEDDCSESRLEDYVNKYFNVNDNGEKLKVILPGCLSDICRALAEFGDEYAAKRIVELSRQKACQYLTSKMPMEEEIDDCLAELRTNGAEIYKDIRNIIDSHKTAGIVPFEANENENQNSSTSNSRGSRTSLARGSRVASSATANGTACGSASTSGHGTITGRGNSRAAAKAPTKERASKATSNRTQPTLQQTMTRKKTRYQVTYDIPDDSD